MKNQKVFKSVIIVVIVVSILSITYEGQTESVVPQCFDREDCAVPVKEGYCSVRYDCIVGKCYHDDIKCSEDCANNKDDDMDGLIDCNDNDCYTSVWCPCSLMSHSKCYLGRCYCESGTPKWFVSEERNWCGCS